MFDHAPLIEIDIIVNVHKYTYKSTVYIVNVHKYTYKSTVYVNGMCGMKIILYLLL